ncbi:hypothetical protein CLAFUR0_07213 [Fulvia fulva]|nr:hypothetical protein CLAFUR0_07213 [Fulvia fulva]
MAATALREPPADTPRSAFFYGTLMAPKVLHRVCHGSMADDNPIYKPHNFKTYPSILHDHQRKKVKRADYPGIVPKPGSSVRGTYVTGLTSNDIWRLDMFEGDEYSREKVKVKVLKEVGNESGEGNIEGEEVEAETYIWIAGEERLEDSEWDFAEFQKEKMRYWVGAEGVGEYAGRASIIGVDEAVAAAEKDGTGGRGANGAITNALNEATRNVV